MAGVLQHLRSSTLNKRPNPASMVDGQVAINYASGSPGMFFKDSNGDLVKVGPVHVGATAPNVSPASGGTAGNSLGEQWLDTSGGTYVFKIWDGAAWRSEAGEFVNVTGDTMTGALGVIAGSASTPGLFISGDANTGIYSPSADQLSITTGGTERLRIDSTGQIEAVSLGTDASPTFTFTGDPNTGIYSPSADELAISTGGTGRLFVDSSGRVGVGTSSPSTRLTVVSTGTVGGVDNATFRSSDDINNSFLIGHSSGVANLVSDQAIGFGNNNGGVYSERARIDSAGRVGIGTTSPSNALHINSGATGTSAKFESTGSGSYLNITNSSGAWSLGATTTNFILENSGGEALRVDGSRRLLVGTSSTVRDSRLCVRGNASGSFTGDMELGAAAGYASISTDNTIGVLRFTESTNGGIFGQIYVESDGTPGNNDYPGRLVFSTTADGASSPTERMRLDRGGVLFNQGTFDTTTANGANMYVFSDGKFSRSTSSSKYKTQIEPIEDSYSDALLACRPVWYRSTCEADCPDHSYWGFIAEEVAQIDKRLVNWKTVDVSYDENGSVVKAPCDPEPEGVAYDRFVPHLLNLIKRQKEQIEAMEARLTALESA